MMGLVNPGPVELTRMLMAPWKLEATNRLLGGSLPARSFRTAPAGGAQYVARAGRPPSATFGPGE